jgi:hypothetical protein
MCSGVASEVANAQETSIRAAGYSARPGLGQPHALVIAGYRVRRQMAGQVLAPVHRRCSGVDRSSLCQEVGDLQIVGRFQEAGGTEPRQLGRPFID